MKPLLATAILLLAGCASNLCVIDAHVQAQRLDREGIPAKVCTVMVGGRNHAVVVWTRKGQPWFYDGSGSYHFSGQPETDIPLLLSVIHHVPATWIRWEDAQ